MKEIQSVDEAMSIIDKQKEGIPYKAIEYLQNQPASKTITDKIVFALNHSYDDTYYNDYEDCWYPIPLWYAIVAEKHISEELITPIINLYTTTNADWDFLNEQGLYLFGGLGNKYPAVLMEKVVKAIDKMVEKESDFPYLFLFNAFHFADIEKYKNWFLATLQEEGLYYWKDAFASQLATLQIKEAIPIIKKLIDDTENEHLIIEFEEALEELETGVDEYPNVSKPCWESRDHWKKHYSQYEESFYREEESTPQELTWAKKIGRNEPCPCGSGKKYKKCCIDK